MLKKEEIQKLAENAGLIVDECKVKQGQFIFISKGELTAWVKMLLMQTGLKGMSSQKRQDAFVHEMVEHYCTKHCTDGVLRYDSAFLHLRASKPA